MPQILHSVFQDFILVSPQTDSVLIQASKDLGKILQMLCIVFSQNENIVNVATHYWQSLQNSIHGLLKNRGSRRNSKRKPRISVETFVGIDHQEILRVFLQGKLQIILCLCQVQFGELLTSSQSGE